MPTKFAFPALTMAVMTLIPVYSAHAQLPEAPDSVKSPPGHMQLLPGYVHTPIQGIDTVCGEITKPGGLKIEYDIGVLAGNTALVMKGQSNTVKYEEHLLNRELVEIAWTKDGSIFATFPETGANFWTNNPSEGSSADFLNMVLTYRSTNPSDINTKYLAFQTVVYSSSMNAPRASFQGNPGREFGVKITNKTEHPVRMFQGLNVEPIVVGPHGRIPGTGSFVLNGYVSINEYPLLAPGKSTTLIWNAGLYWVADTSKRSHNKPRTKHLQLIINDGHHTTWRYSNIKPGSYTIAFRFTNPQRQQNYPGPQGTATVSALWTGNVTLPAKTFQITDQYLPPPIQPRPH